MESLGDSVVARRDGFEVVSGPSAMDFFAQLSPDGDPPGHNYANIKLQQGKVELALAYRIIDDRRGFLDIYAGARYNYFGIDIGASIDDAGVQDVCNDAARRTFGAVGARVQGAVDGEVQKTPETVEEPRPDLCDQRAPYLRMF